MKVIFLVEKSLDGLDTGATALLQGSLSAYKGTYRSLTNDVFYIVSGTRTCDLRGHMPYLTNCADARWFSRKLSALCLKIDRRTAQLYAQQHTSFTLPLLSSHHSFVNFSYNAIEGSL